MSKRFYITTAIPFVNGDPHLGFALECVQADVLARHRRLRGEDVRFLSGTDDNSLKNVEAAERARVPVAEFVNAKAQRFAALRDPLDLSYDDFIRTSVDPRHGPAVERLWRACEASGDLYQRRYEGLYCTGCEAFVTEAELAGGLCPEHGVAPERVAERNWFFRLSHYSDALLELVESGRLRIEPEQRRNEVLGFLRGGLEDFSVSRSRERARGWGIPVPGDPSQVIYVWFDALCNYISALDYGTAGEPYGDWWERSDERLHVIGKGILRFHAVYWPAILLSAGEPLPSAILVHDYLTVDGQKLSKSLGGAWNPVEVAGRYGADALRWWFLRDVPRSGDADFREELLAARANELANGLGNLVNRVIGLLVRFRPDGAEPSADAGSALGRAIAETPAAIDAALLRFDFRAATDALWSLVDEANRCIAATRPWELANGDGDGDGAAEFDRLLGTLLAACHALARELVPFLPAAAARVRDALAGNDPALGRRLFAKRDGARADEYPADKPVFEPDSLPIEGRLA
jgi:methionyl-tRNA synthetase